MSAEWEGVGNFRIAMGDCIEVMRDIKDGSIDMVLCDLPYGCTKNKWDSVIPFDGLWESYERIVKPDGAIVLFASGMFTAELMASNRRIWRYNLVWAKTTPTGFLNAKRMPLRSHEDVCVFYRKPPKYNPIMTKAQRKSSSAASGRGSKAAASYGDYGRTSYDSDERYPTSVLEFATDKQREALHPTQKPVALLRHLIAMYTDEGDAVLDNCMGSGSTGVACIGSGRRFVGIEADEGYYGIAKNRIENAAAQNRLDLFGGDEGPGNPSSCRQATADRELPACEPMTVGAMIYGADYLTGLPDFDRGVPILCGADHESDPDVTAKTMCQHPAKSDGETKWYPDAETALRHVKKGLLQLGA